MPTPEEGAPQPGFTHTHPKRQRDKLELVHAGLEPFPLSELPRASRTAVSFQVSSQGHRGRVRLGRAGLEPTLAWPQCSDLDRTQGSVWMLPQAHCPSSGQPPQEGCPRRFYPLSSVRYRGLGFAEILRLHTGQDCEHVRAEHRSNSISASPTWTGTRRILTNR